MKQYSEEDKAWLVQEWEKSGSSKQAFARELGLNYQTFSTWTRKPEGAGDFVEVGGKLGCGGTAEEPRSGAGMVVESGSIRVHLPAGLTQTDLALVVQALR
jgi:transposase-like protein